MSMLTRRNFLRSLAAAGGLAALQKVVAAEAGGADRTRSHTSRVNLMLGGQKMSDFFRILDTPGTRISGLTIDGDARNQNERQVGGILVRADNCVIEDSEIFNCSGQGIYVQAVKNLKVRRCKIHDIWRQGIAFYGGTTEYGATVIEDCEIARTQYEAIQIGGRGIVIRNNHLSNSPFGGLYALTRSKNFEITRNLVEDGYGGFDLSWGGLNARAGTELSGRRVSDNVIQRCVNGIGTAANGTLLYDNTILDGGKGHQPTYTLLGVKLQVASAGTGYAVGNVLSFVGGETIWNPAKVRVEVVDALGGIIRLSIWYLGCYTQTPLNPIQLAGGTGSGASAQISRWNRRLFVPNGIMVMDASYCAVTGNISGNTSPDNRTQKIGCLLVHTFDRPLKNTIVGNSFPMNLDYPLMGFRGGTYNSSLLTGNTIGMNAS
ncbi:MAG: right-handed parallel beta-helix repeat-containing protein [Chthoniobacterales bacterium]